MTDKVPPSFIKKTVSKKRWDEWYSKSPIYCPLESSEYGMNSSITIGFLTVLEDIMGNPVPNRTGILPTGCEWMTDNEIIKLDDHRKKNNVKPDIYEDFDNYFKDEEDLEKDEAVRALDKLRLQLGMKAGMKGLLTKENKGV